LPAEDVFGFVLAPIYLQEECEHYVISGSFSLFISMLDEVRGG
jgi:hypothetical protein